MKDVSIYEIIKFILAGGVIALSHLYSVYVLTDLLQLFYLFSVILSYSTFTVINFLLQKYFVFSKNEGSTTSIRTQSASFLALGLFSLFLNALAMYILVSMAGWNYLIAQAIVVALLAVMTYLVNKRLIFA
jgi:putative flippase GtrA